MRNYLKTAGCLLVALSVTLPTHSVAQVVGKMTAEKATISKSGVGRIRVGAPISQGDRLSANASGSGMIVFDDESSARLGPNARLTIDDFVYNPSRKTGRISLRQTSGAARIFGGQISKRGSSQVRTPHIVLAVRGGIVDVVVGGGRTISTLRAGVMVCRAGGKKRTVTNPGISCISDGRSLNTGKLTGNGRRFVDSSTAGGPSSDGGANSAFCNSSAGMNSSACRTRDTALPGQRTRPTRNRPGSGVNGLACDFATAGC